MRPVSLILLLILLCSFIMNNKQFEISGEITGYKDGTVIYLRDFHNKTLTSNPTAHIGFIDSTYIVNGKFHFKGKVKYPKLFAIHTEIESNCFQKHGISAFWLENSIVQYNAIHGNLENAVIANSSIQNQANEFQQTIASKLDSTKAFIKAMQQEKNSVTKKPSKNPYKSMEYYNKKCEEFITNNPNYLYSAVLLSNVMCFISNEKVKQLYASFPKEIKSSYYGKEVLAYMKQ